MPSYRTLILSDPGQPQWEDVADFVRTYLYVDHGLNLVCYRPRDDPTGRWRGIDEWNASNAGRPVTTRKLGRRLAVVQIAGTFVSWQTIRLALGVIADGPMNRGLPHVSTMSDAEVIGLYGFDYLLNLARWRMKLDGPPVPCDNAPEQEGTA